MKINAEYTLVSYNARLMNARARARVSQQCEIFLRGHINNNDDDDDIHTKITFPLTFFGSGGK